MLKQFRALPTERRVRDMLDRDYVWCLAQQLLDDEEARCPGCGAPVGTPVKESNPNFDWARFERLKQEGGAI